MIPISYQLVCSRYPFQWVIPTVFLYDLVDHDISSEFPLYIDKVCGSCEKKEKYKFREIFLEISHLTSFSQVPSWKSSIPALDLFTVLEATSPQSACTGQEQNTRYKVKLQITKYLSIECMHRSRQSNKIKKTNERAMEMKYLVLKI